MERARQLRFPHPQHHQAGDAGQGQGHVEHGAEAEQALEGASQHQQGAGAAGEQQGRHRGAARVDRGGERGQQAGAAQTEQDARGGHHHGVDQAEQGQQGHGGDHRAAGRAHQGLGRQGSRQRRAGQQRQGQHVQQGGVDQQVEGRHGQHAADQGAGQVALGLAELLGEVHRAGPAVVGGDHRLQGHHGGGQGPDPWAVLRGCLLGHDGLAQRSCGRQQEAARYQGQQGGGLGQAQPFLAGAAGPQAVQLNQGEQEQQGQGDPPPRQLLRRRWQQSGRQQSLAVVAGGGGHPGQADAVGQPVGPAHQQATAAAEGPLGVHRPAAGAGQGCGQFGRADRPQQGIDAPGQPGTQHQSWCGELSSHHPWCAQDAGADRAAHGAGQTEANPQDGEQPLGAALAHRTCTNRCICWLPGPMGTSLTLRYGWPFTSSLSLRKP